MTLTIIADDLTGACDSGALFCGRGRVGVFIDPALPGAAPEVAAVDTESRALAAADAARRVGEAARHLAPRLGTGAAFKKIDSTLRGSVGAELDALLTASGLAGALLCPSFPAQHRTVLSGVLYVEGVPGHESPVGRDPDYPGATSDVIEILSAQSARPVSPLPLKEVRAGHAELVCALDRRPPGIIVADAETDGDLDALARAGRARPSLLLAGSAGLARALSSELGHAGRRAPMPRGGAWLIVAGSLHPATRAQIEALEAAGVAGFAVAATGQSGAAAIAAEIMAGRPAFITTPAVGPAGPRDERLAWADRLAAAATEVLGAAAPPLVCVIGGETGHALMRALGASHLELIGAPLHGLAIGELVADRASWTGRARLPILTKAGGFGPPDLLLALLGGTPS